ncbi:MAG: hypothetical protein ACRDKI_03460 [Solirubrobacterales bacterium]
MAVFTENPSWSRARTALLALLACALLALVAAPSADAAFGFKAKFGKNSGTGLLGVGDGGLINPIAAATGPSGNIYVLEAADCSVRIYSSSGGFIRRWGGPCAYPFGPPPEAMYQPVAIDVDMNGDVYVLDSYLQHVNIYDGFGNLIRTITGSGATSIGTPGGIAVTPLTATPFVYVSSGDRLQKFDKLGNFIWSRGRDVLATDGDTGSELCTDAADCKSAVTGTGDGEFNFVRGLEIDPTGTNLWIVDRGNQRVQKLLASDGSYVSKFDSTYPDQIARITSSGDLFIASQILRQVNRTDASGNVLSTLSSGTDTAADGEVSAPGQLTEMAGGVAIPDTTYHRVQIFGPTGAYYSKFGKNGGGVQSGTGNGQFNMPADMVQGSGGGIWVTDMQNNRLQAFVNSGGNWIYDATVGAIGTKGLEFSGPNGITKDAAGNIWVADSSNQRIQELNSSGDFIRAFGYNVNNGGALEICTVKAACKAGTAGSATDHFNYPTDVVVNDTSNTLYVAEQNNSRVQKFNATTLASTGIIAPTAPTSAQISQPQSIALDSAGSLYVASPSYNRVAKFDSSDTFVRNFQGDVLSPPYGSTNGIPYGVAVAPNGDVHIAQRDRDNVIVYDSAGNLLRHYGTLGSNDGELYNPRGIVAGNTAGDIFIADQDNHRIQQFGDGVTLGTPSISIALPVAATTFYTATAQLHYVATDSYGGAPACYPGDYTDVPLTVGPNTITVKCNDATGVQFTGNVSVTRVNDTTAPDVTISNPVDGSITGTPSATLNFTTSDDSGVTPTCDRNDGDVVALTAGPNTIVVSCSDGHGNTGVGSTTVTYTPPTVTPPPPAKTPTATLKLPKKVKFKGKIGAQVSCDMACQLQLAVSVKIGKKTYKATATGSLATAGSATLTAKFKKRDAKAIKAALADGKKLTAKLTLSYGAKTGKSGSVKMSK